MKIKNILVLPWTILLLMFRPSIFGEKYNAVIFVLFFAVTLLILFIGSVNLVSMNKRRLVALFLIYSCIVYFLVQGLILSNAKQTVVNSSALLLLTVPCIVLVIKRYQEAVLKIFVNFHYILSISAIITFIIFLLTGLSISKLPIIANLYEIANYGTYDPIRPLSVHVLIIPYTVAWSTTEFLGIGVPRFVGIYREPGMSQIFFITAFILSFFVQIKNQYRKRVILLIGCIILFSAAGMLNLILAIVVLLLFNTNVKQHIKTLIKKPVFILFCCLLFIFISNAAIKMMDKRLYDISGTTRIESFENGIERLTENPFFGEGYYNSFKTDDQGFVTSEQFIGLIGVSYQIGIIGSLLYLMCWGYSLTYLTNKRAICLYIPCLMTLIFSQPSYNDVFTWFLMLIDTRSFTVLTYK